MSESAQSWLHTTSVDGGSPRVVFLHGLFGQGKNFTTIAKALAPQYGSLLVDLPNHGQSGWTQVIAYEDMADAVAETVQGRLPGESVCVVGHSMGGKVAMVLALRHPDLIDRAVVVDISPTSKSDMSEFEYYLDTLAALDLSAVESRADADSALAGPIPDARIRGFLLQNLRRDGDGWRWQANLDLLRRDLPAIGSFPDVASGRSYGGPTLWVAGGRSPYVRAEHAPSMRALFPKVRKVTVKNAGHWVHSEDPDVFTEMLRAFLDS